MHIRREAPSDDAAITKVIEHAFADAPHSDHTEAAIVAALRAADALTVSLVADDAGKVVGYVAFSPVTLSDGALRWHGLGPVAVEPAQQRRGIGDALVRAGLDALRATGAAGCVVLGEPEYYRRFGFGQMEGLVYPGAPEVFFLALSFDGTIPNGVVTYHQAFIVD